jgi:hypothetical protein
MRKPTHNAAQESCFAVVSHDAPGQKHLILGEHSCKEEITKELPFVGSFSLYNDSSFQTFKLLPGFLTKKN